MMKEKGSIMYLSLVVLTMMLGLILGLGAILISQIRIVRGMEYSVNAFYAADSGIEEALFILRKRPPTDFLYPPHPFDFSTLREIQIAPGVIATYKIRIDRGAQAPGGSTGGCSADRYCIRSIGEFKGTQRAIEVRDPRSP